MEGGGRRGCLRVAQLHDRFLGVGDAYSMLRTPALPPTSRRRKGGGLPSRPGLPAGVCVCRGEPRPRQDQRRSVVRCFFERVQRPACSPANTRDLGTYMPAARIALARDPGGDPLTALPADWVGLVRHGLKGQPSTLPKPTPAAASSLPRLASPGKELPLRATPYRPATLSSSSRASLASLA